MITTAVDSHNASGFNLAIYWVDDRLLFDCSKSDNRHVVHERYEGRCARLPAESSNIIDEYSTI